MKENITKKKSFDFAVLIVRLCNELKANQSQYELTSQLIRSGTAIGALINEAQFAESKRDFIHKLSIALKEANETCYWIDLLFASEIIEEDIYKSLSFKVDKLLKLLIASIKTLKINKFK